MMKKSIVSLVLSLTLCLCLSVSASAYEMSKPGQVPTISSGQCGHTGIVDSNGTLWMCGRNFHGEVLGVDIIFINPFGKEFADDKINLAIVGIVGKATCIRHHTGIDTFCSFL